MDDLNPPEMPQSPTPPVLPASPPPPLRAPAPARRRRRFGWIIAAAVLLGVVLLALAGSLANDLLDGLNLASGSYTARPHPMVEVVVKDNDSRHKIAVVELTGIITGDPIDHEGRTLVDFVKEQLKRATEDDRVQAVILRIDSPGGEVLASDDISEAIRKFQKESDKPVVASLGSVAASGGYYTAVPCRWIVAHELTITGSIGVLLHSYNYRGLLSKVGVRPEIYKSGRFKDMLSGEKLEEEISADEKRMVQGLIDETFARFKSVVRDGRTSAAKANGANGRPLSENWEEQADGRILSGRQAYELGFVDELGGLDAAVQRALKLSDIPDANLIRYLRPFDLGSLFRLFGQTEGRSVKLDLGFELPQLPAGRLYFLSPALVH